MLFNLWLQWRAAITYYAVIRWRTTTRMELVSETPWQHQQQSPFYALAHCSNWCPCIYENCGGNGVVGRRSSAKKLRSCPVELGFLQHSSTVFWNEVGRKRPRFRRFNSDQPPSLLPMSIEGVQICRKIRLRLRPFPNRKPSFIGLGKLKQSPFNCGQGHCHYGNLCRCGSCFVFVPLPAHVLVLSVAHNFFPKVERPAPTHSAQPLSGPAAVSSQIQFEQVVCFCMVLLDICEFVKDKGVKAAELVRDVIQHQLRWGRLQPSVGTGC